MSTYLLMALNETARYQLWMDALREQGRVLLHLAGLGILPCLLGFEMAGFFPRLSKWLIGLGVGGFYGTLAALWWAVRVGAVVAVR